ncbi:MAG TPA: MotA/TolQ/ExbB proton channel family protein, partial [Devosia sp.]|nr:MotA/TolQ/ExbB proton channel family protein [Devosia sp.]
MSEILITQLTGFGGPILVALVLCSIVALATSIVKAIQFAQLGVGRHRVGKLAAAAWRRGDRPAAMQLVERDGSALSGVSATAMALMIGPPSDPDWARQSAVLEATETLALMGRHLRILETIVQAAPMLGLLGTVIGMIEAFSKLSGGGGAADPAALAGGIWIALSTTALGLMVAIPFYFL